MKISKYGRDIPTIVNKKEANEVDIIYFINSFEEITHVSSNNIEVKVKKTIKKRMNFHIFEITQEEMEILKEECTWRL